MLPLPDFLNGCDALEFAGFLPAVKFAPFAELTEFAELTGFTELTGFIELTGFADLTGFAATATAEFAMAPVDGDEEETPPAVPDTIAVFFGELKFR